jgi:hypothetical protein
MLYQLSYAGALQSAIAHSDKTWILTTGYQKRKLHSRAGSGEPVNEFESDTRAKSQPLLM